MSQVKKDEMLVRLGENGSLGENKELRVSLQLARGKIYEVLARAFGYPWNRKFFRAARAQTISLTKITSQFSSFC